MLDTCVSAPHLHPVATVQGVALCPSYPTPPLLYFLYRLTQLLSRFSFMRVSPWYQFSTVAHIPMVGTCWKLKATRGSVKIVAAADVAIASMKNRCTLFIQPPSTYPVCTNLLHHRPSAERSRAIPDTAVKLSWKEISLRTGGSNPTINPAARANAGKMLFGRPMAWAAKYMVPMMAARSTDGDSPLINA